MKNFVDKLKRLDYKQLALNHGEKFALGIVGLIVLLAVAGSRWSPYEKKPNELETQATTAEQEIAKSEWPQEERTKFTAEAQLADRMDKLMSPLSPGEYAYNTEFLQPLQKGHEPIQEPEWLAVQNPRADSGRVILALRPEGGQYPGSEEMAAGGAPPDSGQGPGERPSDARSSDRSSRLARRDRSGAGRRGAPGADLMYGEEQYVPEQEGTRATYDQMYGGAMEEGAYPGSYEGGYGGMGGGQNGRGYRYVAMRGVFPLHNQLRKVADAMNLSQNQVQSQLQNSRRGNELVDIIDFELQRQQAQPGPDPWSGPWEEVDIEAAVDVLEKAASFDPEVVEPRITDDVITMPLPQRIVGYWSSHATHPRVEKFRLSPEQMERERERQEKLMEHFQKMQQEAPLEKGGFAGQQQQRGGFSGQVYDYAEVQDAVMSNEQYRNDYRQALQGMPGGEQMVQDLDEERSAAGYLLLFRYFDFDVEPGHAYRYRVRLVLRNPNYDRPLPQLAHAGVAEGRTRPTPWSEPTNPAVVPRDTQYFLEEVDPPRGRSAPRPMARLKLFQWSPETGTTMRDVLKLDLGQFVGGETETEVLDPAAGTFEEETFQFESDDVLVDASETPRLAPDDFEKYYADLNLSGAASFDVPERALVVNESGELASLDPISRKEKESKADSNVDLWHTEFQDLKQRARPAEGEAGAYYGLEEYAEQIRGGGESAQSGGSSYRRSSNPLRKSQRGGSGRRGRGRSRGSR